MGSGHDARQRWIGPAADARPSSRGERPIVAFDFDGTLTTRDSFTAFLMQRGGWLLHLGCAIRLIPALLRYLFDRDRGRLKAAAVRVCLRGKPRADLDREVRDFAERVRLFRPDALAAWRRHGADGDLRVIVTASPEEIVAPFAAALGADALLGTRLAFDDDERVTGAFVGENCRGEEKVRRLRERFGPDMKLAAAYGDTAGDREMLALAEAAGYRVFIGAPA